LFDRYGGGAVIEMLIAAADGSGHDREPPRAVVKTFIPVADVEARARVEEGLWHLGRIVELPEATVRTLAQANWAEAWKAHYAPQRIGRHIVVVPSWAETPALEPGDFVIRLDPGMAFGTGLHPTTRLCLTALEAVVQTGASVLDVGTGSGILLIGAARLGAERLVGCDTDPGAIQVATTNAAANDVAAELVAGPLDRVAPETFDVVVANILAGVITALAPALAARLRPGGRLIVSGILDDQAAAVRTSLEECGLAWVSQEFEKDWAALVFANP
jgi:ribosomal protein L11 methyltransferase